MGHDGLSHLELLVLLEQWMGHRELCASMCKLTYFHSPPVSSGVEIRLECQFLSPLVKTLGKLLGDILPDFFPVLLVRNFPDSDTWAGNSLSCVIRLSQCASQVAWVPRTGAAAELLDGTLKLCYCTSPFGKVSPPGPDPISVSGVSLETRARKYLIQRGGEEDNAPGRHVQGNVCIPRWNRDLPPPLPHSSLPPTPTHQPPLLSSPLLSSPLPSPPLSSPLPSLPFAPAPPHTHHHCGHFCSRRHRSARFAEWVRSIYRYNRSLVRPGVFASVSQMSMSRQLRVGKSFASCLMSSSRHRLCCSPQQSSALMAALGLRTRHRMRYTKNHRKTDPKIPKKINRPPKKKNNQRTTKSSKKVQTPKEPHIQQTQKIPKTST